MIVYDVPYATFRSSLPLPSLLPFASPPTLPFLTPAFAVPLSSLHALSLFSTLSIEDRVHRKLVDDPPEFSVSVLVSRGRKGPGRDLELNLPMEERGEGEESSKGKGVKLG